jgi:integration host factor subunit beta
MTMTTGGSMTKAELVEEVSRVSDLTKKHSEVIVDTVFKSIIDALHRGEKIELRGFGSFRLRKREPRKGRNPRARSRGDAPIRWHTAAGCMGGMTRGIDVQTV